MKKPLILPLPASRFLEPMAISLKSKFGTSIRRFLLAGLVFPVTASAGVYAHYSFDADDSDSSVNQRDGTLVDTETTGNSGIVSSPGSFKFGGGTMNFSGDRDYVTVPLKSFSSGTPYTIAFWARKEPGDTGDRALWDMVIGQRESSNFFIGLGDSSGETGLRWRSAGTTTDRQADFSVPKDNIWHHYAVVASGTTITLYLDGQPFGSATGMLTGFTFDTIGDGYPSTRRFGFHGQIDEMWVFDEALDASAVSRIHLLNDAGVAPSTATRLRVYLLGGQSNGDGRAAISELPVELQSPQSNVDFYYKVEGSVASLTTLRPGLSETSQFGPEIMLGNRLAKLHAHEQGTRVAIIKYANGGTNLHTQWKAGGDGTISGDGPEYLVFQQTVQGGLAALAAAHPLAEINLEGMTWMQGEADASAEHAALYQSRLATFISDVRATFGQTLPFIIGCLSSGQTYIPAQYLSAVRSAQDAVAAADPLTGIVNTDGLGMKSDNLHFNGAGQQAMGSDFAGQAAYYAWLLETFSAEDIAAGLAEPDADRDGDGQSNHAEFITGTVPLSGDSQFRVWFSMAGPGEGGIAYLTSRSRTYGVEKYSEEDGTWKTALPATQGSGDMVLRLLNTSRVREFYRVSVELP